MFFFFLFFLVHCAVSHHHGARRSSNRNSFTFFRLHCLYVLTRWRAGLCMGSILAEFLAGHIHNWLKSMALKTPSTKRYIGEIKCISGSCYPLKANHNIGHFFEGSTPPDKKILYWSHDCNDHKKCIYFLIGLVKWPKVVVKKYQNFVFQLYSPRSPEKTIVSLTVLKSSSRICPLL